MPLLDAQTIRQAICGRIAGHPVKTGYGNRISVPFTDRYGAPLVVYVDKDGHLTDAAEYLSELHAMGASEDWVEWAHREEFLRRNNIVQHGRELRAASTDKPDDILTFLQGLSRVTSFFSIQAEDTGDSKFVNKVRRRMRDQLVEYAPVEGAVNWIGARMKRRKVYVGDYPIELDLSPVDEDLLVQVIGYQDAKAGAQFAHARQKTNAFLAAHVWELEEKKSSPKFARVAVVPDLQDYGTRSRKMIEKAATHVIEFEASDAQRELAKALSTPQVRADFL